MAVTATPAFPQAINTAVQTILPADTTTAKTIFTAGANGSKIDAIFVTSTDTAARDLILNVVVSATAYPIGIVSIPITAGTVSTVPTVDYLRSAQVPSFSFDAFGNKCMYIAAGVTLTANVGVAVTAAKVITIVVQGSDF